MAEDRTGYVHGLDGIVRRDIPLWQRAIGKHDVHTRIHRHQRYLDRIGLELGCNFHRLLQGLLLLQWATGEQTFARRV